MEYLAPIGSSLFVHGPVYATLLVGIVLALVRWSRHPRTSLFAVLGLGGLFVFSVAGTAVGIALPMVLRSQEVGTAKIAMSLAAWGMATALLQAGSWVLVLIALFGPRTGDRQPAA